MAAIWLALANMLAAGLSALSCMRGPILAGNGLIEWKAFSVDWPMRRFTQGVLSDRRPGLACGSALSGAGRLAFVS